jgi:hypothetical protein
VADDPTELTQAQQDFIVKRISEKWAGDRDCAVCRDNKWVLLPHLTTPVKLTGMTPNLNFPGKSIYPQAQLVCSTCGNTLTFNISALGLDLDKPQTRAERLYNQNLENKQITGELARRLGRKDDAQR